MADYATLLRDHVTLKVRSIDRIFLQAYVPKLQSVGQVCRFLRWQKGYPIPSSAAFGKIGEAYVKAVEAKHPHMEWGRQMAYINHYYFYLWDPEWGPTFWKTNAYAPFPIWLWLNGRGWAKRQMEKAGIAYEALDNGFLSCADPETLQRRCDDLGSDDVQDFFQRWSSRLPSPFTKADLTAGYGYDLAFRQFEVSETSIFDRPQAGRAWFEGVIRDHLDIGRPDQVALIFQRAISRRTPGRFRTRVIVKGVEPILTCYYKSSRLKQYFKEGRGLRNELVICNTRDFLIGRRVCVENWNALRAVGESANRRLCDAEAQDAMPAPDVVTFQRVTQPSTNEDGSAFTWTSLR